MENGFSGPKKPTNDYEGYKYFDNPKERHDIYEFSKELGEYLHKENIQRIIFLDRSSRLAWVGLDEYWKQNFKDEKHPDYFFLNPNPFNGTKEIVVLKNSLEELSELENLVDTKSEIPQDKQKNANQFSHEVFQERYTKLSYDKDAPLAIFDTCAHSGDTITGVVNMLRNSGFRDLRILTAKTPSTTSGIVSEAILNKNTLMDSCYPFGRATGVENEWGITSSRRNHSRINVIRARQEIRKILQGAHQGEDDSGL